MNSLAKSKKIELIWLLVDRKGTSNAPA